MPPITLIQTNFTAGEISPRLFGRVDLDKYRNGTALMQNMYPLPHGGATRRTGFQFIREVMGRDRVPGITWNLETGWSGSGAALSVSGSQTEASTARNTDAYPAGRVYEVSLTVSSYAAGALTIQSEGEGSTPITADGDYAARVKTGADGFVSLVADADFNASLADIKIREVGPKARLIPFEFSTEQAYVLEFTDLNMRVYCDGGIIVDDNEDPIEVTTPWTEDDLDRLSYTQSADLMDVVHPEVPPQQVSRTSPTEWAVNQTSFTWSGVTDDWNSTDGYPSCVTYFEERKVFAGSPKHPQRIWMSDSSDYNKFSKSTPLVDTDACVYTLSADQVNSIRALVSRSKLIILTSGGEWWMRGGSGTDQVTPKSVKTARSTTYGTKNFLPVTAGHAILFMQRDSRSVRELTYSFEQDDYIAPDVSILAEHLLRGHDVKAWAYQQSPGSVIWMAREDGKLLSLTYQREHDVIGFAHHETDGYFESLAAIYGDEGDELWTTVVREINGITTRYVERKTKDFEGETADSAFFVDSGLTYESDTPAKSFFGLEHLEGKTVAILADGAVIPSQKVIDGSISIPIEATQVCVGLPYESNLQTLNLEAGQPTAQSLKKNITSVTIRLFMSLGFKIGSDENNLQTVPFRKSKDKMNNPPALFTGDKEQVFSAGWNTEGRVYVRQDQPLPLTILAIMPKVQIEGG